jgi:hypothetical protein
MPTVSPRQMFQCRSGLEIWYEVATSERTKIQRDLDYDRFKPLVLGRVRESATYNCLGHVFASSRGILTDGLETPPPGYTGAIDGTVRNVLAADGYRRRATGEEPRPGDVVVYEREGRIEHVGVLASTGLQEPVVQSKWGLGAEYRHLLSSVPEIYGEPTVWTLERVFDGDG